MSQNTEVAIVQMVPGQPQMDSVSSSSTQHVITQTVAVQTDGLQNSIYIPPPTGNMSQQEIDQWLNEHAKPINPQIYPMYENPYAGHEPWVNKCPWNYLCCPCMTCFFFSCIFIPHICCDSD